MHSVIKSLEILSSTLPRLTISDRYNKSTGGFFDTKIAAVLSKGIKFDDIHSALAACGGVANGIANELTLWQQTGSCSDAARLRRHF